MNLQLIKQPVSGPNVSSVSLSLEQSRPGKAQIALFFISLRFPDCLPSLEDQKQEVNDKRQLE